MSNLRYIFICESLSDGYDKLGCTVMCKNLIKNLIKKIYKVSDGNFNRSMLPSNNYQSGIRAGKAQMKKLSLDAFKKWCEETFPQMEEQERHECYLNFKKHLEEV